MNDTHSHAHDQFRDAVRAMATSPSDLPERLLMAFAFIREVTLDEFAENPELKLRLARILDLLAADSGDVDEEVAHTAFTMTELDASKAADLICDFYFDLD